jgi:uncharacterized protein (TIGR03067 family)
MNVRVLAVLFVGSMLAAGASGQEKGKTDEDKIQGTWIPLYFERDGKKGPEGDLKDTKMTIAAGKLKVTMGPKEMELGYKLDPTKKPKEIDITETEGGKDQVHKGIYELDGDNLKICFAHAPGERPTAIQSEVGRDHRIVVLKRAPK